MFMKQSNTEKPTPNSSSCLELPPMSKRPWYRITYT